MDALNKNNLTCLSLTCRKINPTKWIPIMKYSQIINIYDLVVWCLILTAFVFGLSVYMSN